MGEVYRAKDQKLGRDVAIKLLPEEFAKDADRVARFQREAKLLASLNHNNIASIYGFEESDGTHILVLELIEGDTLADRLKHGAIPVEESLKLALQIAEALEAAHEKGVIHRDLKPANIKVTPDGNIKVLDFGLAKAFAGEQKEMVLSESPTLSVAATQQGVILGTAAYMSPEQAKGKSVDKRADIWAFGVVLFEMLSGRTLFTGETVSETLASVIKSEPEWKSLPPNLHPRIRFLLERCLKKEPKNRYSGISDARVDIQEVLADPTGVLVEPGVEAKANVQQILKWVAAAVLLTAIIASVAVWLLKPAPPPVPKQVQRSYYEVPEDQQFIRGLLGNIILAISPDGSRFAYSTTDGIYTRSMNELEARLIPGSDEDAKSLSFSPDSQWIVYFSSADKKLKKISVNGGVPESLCDAARVVDAYWNEDNTIIYSDYYTGLYRVSENGGTPEPIFQKEIMPFAQILPDGKSVMFPDISGEAPKTVVQSLESEDQEVIFDAIGGYLPTGHFIYTAEDGLWAAPFDLGKLKITGGSVRVMEPTMGFAWSDSGTLIHIPNTAEPGEGTAAESGESAESPKRTLVWVYRDGTEEPLEADPDDYQDCKISPDGKEVAVDVMIDGNRDIMIWDTVDKKPTRLTFDESIDNTPVWTRDGKRVVFWSHREGGRGGIFWKSADGMGKAEKLFSALDAFITPSSWSGDGKILVLNEVAQAPMRYDIGILSIEGDRQKIGLLQKKPSEPLMFCIVSPNGKWIAYTAVESGRMQIFVSPFPDVNEAKWQVSTKGGACPRWSPDGKELYYINNDQIMAVSVETDQKFSCGNPEVLFEGTFFSLGIGAPLRMTPWDIHPDGQRFLMIKPSEAVASEKPSEEVTDEETSGESTAEIPRKIIIVTNWFEELKELAPVE